MTLNLIQLESPKQDKTSTLQPTDSKIDQEKAKTKVPALQMMKYPSYYIWGSQSVTNSS